MKHGSQLQWMISAGALLLVVELFQLDFVSSVMPWNMIELVHLWNRSVSLPFDPTAWPEPWQWMVFCQKRGPESGRGQACSHFVSKNWGNPNRK